MCILPLEATPGVNINRILSPEGKNETTPKGKYMKGVFLG